MFIQIHILQSMPPGNLNRDETGQPKKCIFGGVTRGRISSQCLKRNIRRSPEFAEAFGDALADRTTYLPKMVADAIKRDSGMGIPEDDLDPIMAAIAGEFRKEKKQRQAENSEDGGESDTDPAAEDGLGQTGQLVFIPPPFASAIARRVAEFRKKEPQGYKHFLGTLKPKPKGGEKKALDKKKSEFFEGIAADSKSLTVDISSYPKTTLSSRMVQLK